MSRHLVVITAGVSEPSSTRLLADQLSDATRAAVSARGEEVDVRVIEVRELARDLATVMTTGVPTPALTAAKDAVAEADGVIAVSPVFTASYSGLFKMFVDALDPDTLTGVPVMVAATAGTPRHSLVLDHALRPLFAYLRAQILPTGVFAATEDFGSSELAARIGRAAAELATAIVTDDGAVSGFGGPSDLSRPRRSGKANDLGPVTDFAELLRGHTGD
ncbi:FMN reductase [Tsukamurella paurometabola]|uniref:NADPH-dependent FMN reductase n=1 Tax=Tsukamurella paurometabola (strain ATCC 8368 / DSM 20162 / CCUG 35730 / CIP 100753 / JCM 10117 / KCTC 9821 / NBRC 16120 / NCIMB 702349 / NCTC 13040) TaxID=521096 RepID=D5UNP9_TSUPD|nr:FMN reductase [Tsukamurella paurometabola]ADG78617.1 NADPH-dependent FMN reductase [Tsukamurella paurometabola DSM 20162]SUP32441.1 FMN reductase (NADPH) [Tsukamurella paurometabola]